MFSLEPARRAFYQCRIDREQARDGALSAKAGNLEIPADDAIGGFAAAERARFAERFAPSMLHRVPCVSERVVTLFDLEREKLFLQLFHRAIELRPHPRLRVSRAELERLGLRSSAPRERIH